MAVVEATAAGAIVVIPSSMGVGLLEFHQLDRMVESGRPAGRASSMRRATRSAETGDGRGYRLRETTRDSVAGERAPRVPC